MATRVEASDRGSIAIGSVLARAFGVMRGNPVAVFGIAFLFGALPQAVFSYFLRIETQGDINAQLGLAGLYVGYLLIFLLCSALTQAALVRAASSQLEGRAASIGECLGVAIGKVLPIIGLSLLLTLGIFAGFLLFVVPGIILALMWIVTVPVLVEEGTGVIGAFGRSRRLTKGVRWQILFLAIVTIVIWMLIGMLALVPMLIVGVGQTGDAALSPGAMIFSLVTSTLTTALWSAVVTTLYFALRDRLDGPRAEQLADVFA